MVNGWIDMKQKKFKGSFHRRFKEGEIGQDVHTKVRYNPNPHGRNRKPLAIGELTWYEKIISFFLKK